MNLDTAGHQRSLELRELPLASRGAAPTCQRSGEATSAVCGTGSSGRESRPRAQARATEQGQSGVDARTVDDLVVDLRDHWSATREQLLTGRC